MFRRPPLACPNCATERSRESSYGARICEACGIEFRPRERVPIRAATPRSSERIGWMITLAVAALGATAGVRMAMNSPPSEFPPAVPEPIVMQPIVPIDFDASVLPRPLEPPSVDVVVHRLERREGRVEATGALSVASQGGARPRVHVGFFDSDGVEIGAVLAHVACARMDDRACPWGFSGSEPPGTVEVRVRASGDVDLGDLHPTARMQFSFDDEFEPTDLEAEPPPWEIAEAELIPKKRGRELEVRVGVPEPLRLRDARATLVGYAYGGRVELVVPLPSPVGLSRRVELPEHEHAIVRWQLWVDGSISSW